MTLQEELLAMLAPLAGGRRYWGKAPQGTQRPFLTMNQIGGRRHYHNQGETSLQARRVQFDVYADTGAEASALMSAVLKTLSGRTSEGLRGIFFDSPRDSQIQDAGNVSDVARVTVDAICQWSH